MSLLKTRRDSAIAIGLTLLTAYAYFYQGGGWNQNSRFAMVRAIVEQGTLRIDDTVYFDGERITGDLARHDGHLYSDKAPGLALSAVPIVALLRPLVSEPASPRGIALLSYVATVITVSVPTVIAALLVFQLAGALGASHSASVFGALVFGLGTPAWCYATLFNGHALATACLVVAFSAALSLREQSSAMHERLLASAVGLGGGWATVTDYTAVVPAILITFLAIVCARSNDPRHVRRVIADLTVTALVCAAVLTLINQLSFGGPFNVGYSNEVYYQEFSERFFGLRAPRPDVLRAVLFGEFRGLLPIAPVLVLAPIGFALLARDRSSRAAALTAAAITTYYIVFLGSAWFWWGGWAFGPRYMASLLPFASLAVAIVWSRARRRAFRFCLLALALYGACVTFVAVSTTAQPPENVPRPVRELLWPNFVAGRLSTNWQSFVEGDLRSTRDASIHAWNLGEKLGLSGLPSLLPLISIWSAIWVWWAWHRRKATPVGRANLSAEA